MKKMLHWLAATLFVFNSLGVAPVPANEKKCTYRITLFNAIIYNTHSNKYNNETIMNYLVGICQTSRGGKL